MANNIQEPIKNIYMPQAENGMSVNDELLTQVQNAIQQGAEPSDVIKQLSQQMAPEDIATIFTQMGVDANQVQEMISTALQPAQEQSPVDNQPTQMSIGGVNRKDMFAVRDQLQRLNNVKIPENTATDTNEYVANLKNMFTQLVSRNNTNAIIATNTQDALNNNGIPKAAFGTTIKYWVGGDHEAALKAHNMTEEKYQSLNPYDRSVVDSWKNPASETSSTLKDNTTTAGPNTHVHNVPNGPGYFGTQYQMSPLSNAIQGFFGNKTWQLNGQTVDPRTINQAFRGEVNGHTYNVDNLEVRNGIFGKPKTINMHLDWDNASKFNTVASNAYQTPAVNNTENPAQAESDFYHRLAKDKDFATYVGYQQQMNPEGKFIPEGPAKRVDLFGQPGVPVKLDTPPVNNFSNGGAYDIMPKSIFTPRENAIHNPYPESFLTKAENGMNVNIPNIFNNNVTNDPTDTENLQLKYKSNINWQQGMSGVQGLMNQFSGFLNKQEDINNARNNAWQHDTSNLFQSTQGSNGLYDQWGNFKPDEAGAKVMPGTGDFSSFAANNENRHFSGNNVLAHGGDVPEMLKQYLVGGNIDTTKALPKFTEDEIKFLKERGFNVSNK